MWAGWLCFILQAAGVNLVWNGIKNDEKFGPPIQSEVRVAVLRCTTLYYAVLAQRRILHRVGWSMNSSFMVEVHMNLWMIYVTQGLLRNINHHPVTDGKWGFGLNFLFPGNAFPAKHKERGIPLNSKNFWGTFGESCSSFSRKRTLFRGTPKELYLEEPPMFPAGMSFQISLFCQYP